MTEAKATDNSEVYGALYNWAAALTSCPVAIVLRMNKWGRYGIGDSPYKNIDFGFSVRCVKDE